MKATIISFVIAIWAALLISAIIMLQSTQADLKVRTNELRICTETEARVSKDRKEARDKEECSSLAQQSDRLLEGVHKLDDQRYIQAWQVSFGACMDRRAKQ